MKAVAWRAFVSVSVVANRARHIAALQPHGTSHSVSATLYHNDDAPTVTLYTKAGCTLCDVVKDTLEKLASDHPHSLKAVDITDDDNKHFFDKYKYDIPVLHIDGAYWAKHRLSTEEAIEGLQAARAGEFCERRGEPDAARLERRRGPSR